jgi:hypothetical protein
VDYRVSAKGRKARQAFTDVRNIRAFNGDNGAMLNGKRSIR